MSCLQYRPTLPLSQKFIQCSKSFTGVRDKLSHLMRWKMLWILLWRNEWGWYKWWVSKLLSTWDNFSQMVKVLALVFCQLVAGECTHPRETSWPEEVILTWLRQELVKLLIAPYNGYKRPSNFETCAVTMKENLSGHFLGELEGRKKACAMCTKVGWKSNEGSTFETSYACEQCDVPLCHQMWGEQSCFAEWHSGNL